MIIFMQSPNEQIKNPCKERKKNLNTIYKESYFNGNEWIYSDKTSDEVYVYIYYITSVHTSKRVHALSLRVSR